MAQPFRRIRLQEKHGFGQGKFRRQMKQNVGVIFSSTHGQDLHVVVFANSCEIGPEARLQFLFYDFAAVFGAEDDVHVILGECVGQCAAPCACPRKSAGRPTGLILYHSASQRFSAGLSSGAPDGASDVAASATFSAGLGSGAPDGASDVAASATFSAGPGSGAPGG
jgi:hypothetical protein